VVLGSTKLGGREGPAIAKARFTRTNSTSSTAVLAITTPEDEEGFEVGTLLLRELITEALEQGVDRFRTETHHNTPAMFRLLARFGRIKLRPSGVLELAIARS
jgi:L-amino acid N-acyltransferase YncA